MSVGFVGGFSWKLVRVADKTVFAYPLVAMNRSMRGVNRIACSRNMTGLLLEGWTRFGDPISSCRRRQVSPKQHSLDVCLLCGPPSDKGSRTQIITKVKYYAIHDDDSTQSL